jgi:hypothetical protein
MHFVPPQQSANIIKKMPLPPPKNRSAYGTYLYFAEPGVLETFRQDYRRILSQNAEWNL